ITISTTPLANPDTKRPGGPARRAPAPAPARRPRRPPPPRARPHRAAPPAPRPPRPRRPGAGAAPGGRGARRGGGAGAARTAPPGGGSAGGVRPPLQAPGAVDPRVAREIGRNGGGGDLLAGREARDRLLVQPEPAVVVREVEHPARRQARHRGAQQAHVLALD